MRQHDLFDRVTAIPAPAAELYAWHTRPGAFQRLVPPWQSVEILGGAPAVENGSRLELALRKGPARIRWTAEHRRVRPGESFEDVQISGPFALWEHTHRFEQGADGGSLLRDRIRYRLPGGAAGRLVLGAGVRRDLERTFRYRHDTTAADLAFHGRYRDRPRLRVAVSGAGGLIGAALTALLTTGGHEVIRLVRAHRPGEDDAARWHPAVGLVEAARLEGVDAVIHLAGENIGAGRWTSRRKRRIRDSRTEGTRNLFSSLQRLEAPPRILVCASAIGYYGDGGEDLLDERADPGSGFLADVCRDWERAARTAAGPAARLALARFGVVLSPRSGLLSRLLLPFLLGLGGPIGHGRQPVSWISVDDAAAALLHVLLTEGLEGPVNITSPQPVANRELGRALGRVLGRPSALPLPAAAARLLFGQMADELMLSGARVRPARLLESGFRFRHADLESALRHLLGR